MSKLLACFTWQLAVVMNMILVYTKTKKLCVYSIALLRESQFNLFSCGCRVIGLALSCRNVGHVLSPSQSKSVFRKQKMNKIFKNKN